MQPKNHFLSIDNGYGHTIRAQVIYLQPKAERTYKQEAAIQVLASGIFFHGSYSAVYETPQQTIQGEFRFTSGKVSKRSSDNTILMSGTFVVKSTDGVTDDKKRR